MKKCFVFFLANILLLIANAQTYWQQQVDYAIDVSLNDKEKTLDGFERLVYTNNSPDTLRYIWFHLWPNAYKNDKTAFTEQLLRNGDTWFYFSDKEQRGYINRLDFKVDGTTAQTEDHPQHIDIIKVVLPQPLFPRQKITITTPFHVKLPFNFSRGGYDGQSFQLTQWYPKPAVYDQKGWHPMPYLDQGEFYSEFGSFDVRFTVPKAYAVAATGVLQNEAEKAWLKSRENFLLPPVVKQHKPQPYRSAKAKPKPVVPALPETGETKTLHYKQDSIHDFALFASKEFIVKSDTLQLPSGRIVNVA
ncbi:MAG: M1 family peptidase, partial [Chitinophagaceae bacterium]